MVATRNFMMRFGKSLHQSLTLLVVCLMLMAAPTSHAGMKEIIDAIKASEFRFARSVSEVPSMPMGWLVDRFYPNAGFELERSSLPTAMVEENAIGVGTVLPAMVMKRDMLLLGGDVSMDLIRVNSGPFHDQSVVRITPVAAWLRQVNRDNLIGSFVAPIFSKEVLNGGDWGTSGYAGIVAMHWRSDTLKWLYGGVYENSFGRDAFYPYLGMQWTPISRMTVALIIPWPTITYSPNSEWILQLGLSPGGSSWVRRKGSYEITESFGSWNLSIGAGYRVHDNFWLVGSAGLAGLRAWQLGEKDSGLRYEARSSAVFSIALQFRP